MTRTSCCIRLVLCGLPYLAYLSSCCALCVIMLGVQIVLLFGGYLLYCRLRLFLVLCVLSCWVCKSSCSLGVIFSTVASAFFLCFVRLPCLVLSSFCCAFWCLYSAVSSNWLVLPCSFLALDRLYVKKNLYKTWV